MRSIDAMGFVVAALGGSCAGDWISPEATVRPVIEHALVTPNDRNVLSAVVVARVRDADSVAVRYRALGEAGENETPFMRARPGMTRVPVLGLRPEQQYELRVIAFNRNGSSVADPIDLLTRSLPPDVPTYSTMADNSTQGFVAIAAGKYGLVLDNTGRVVWYHYFANGPWLNFMPANGRYVARNVTPDATDIESWIELDPLGNTTRFLGCRMGLQARFHDLIVEPDGGYWILCDETRTMNLKALGGVSEARVTGTAVQHIGANGDLLFHWTPFDHFAITDVDSLTRAGFSVNWTHGNSLDLDADGNLLVSFRNLNEITSIDTKTGAVRWRLGGLRNQFTLTDDSRLFAGQHSIRALPSGEILLLDNVGDSLESRVESWRVDPIQRTAHITGSYGSIPRVRTLLGGSVQQLSSTRTLVSFGTEGRVEEYDRDGNVRWRIEGAPGYVFRAQRFPSLYRPGIGGPR